VVEFAFEHAEHASQQQFPEPDPVASSDAIAQCRIDDEEAGIGLDHQSVLGHRWIVAVFSAVGRALTWTTPPSQGNGNFDMKKMILAGLAS
jgi:hypothetical protein